MRRTFIFVTNPAPAARLGLLALLALALVALPATGQESPDDEEDEPKASATVEVRPGRIVIDIDPDEELLELVDPEDFEVRIERQEAERERIKRELRRIEIDQGRLGVREDIQRQLAEVEAELEDAREDEERLRERYERDAERARRRADRDFDDGDLSGQVRFDIDSDDGELVRIGRSLVIGIDDVVQDAVVLGGTLRVRGEIDGDAVVVGGNMYVEDGAIIGGDAVVIGGKLKVEAGADIDGQRVELGVFSPVSFGGSFGGGSQQSGVMDMLSSFLFLLIILLVGWGATSLMGGRFDNMVGAAQDDMLKALLVGLLTLVLWLPAVALCVITIIGIPVAIALLAALPIACFLGFFVGAQVLGQRLSAGIRFERQSKLAHMLVGLTAILAISILGKALGLLGDSAALLALGFEAAGAIVGFVASTIGLGALVMTRFGRRREPSALPPIELPPAPLPAE